MTESARQKNIRRGCEMHTAQTKSERYRDPKTQRQSDRDKSRHGDKETDRVKQRHRDRERQVIKNTEKNQRDEWQDERHCEID